MIGQGQLIRLFTAARRDEKISEAQIRVGNADRSRIVPLSSPEDKLLPHSGFRRPSQLKSPGWAGSPAPAPWRIFNFPGPKLVKLKEEAAKECGSDKKVGWLSTNDAVVTLLWQRLSVARAKRLGPDTKTTLIRAMNARRAAKVSNNYLGHLVACTWTPLPMSAVADSPLSSTAVEVRKSLNEIDYHHVRSLVTQIHAEKDKTTFGYEATMNPETDIMLSSWAELGTYQCDFGPLLGKPGFVRRPLLTECQSLGYFMPRTDEGDIALEISLAPEDAKALVEDAVWMEYAEVID